VKLDSIAQRFARIREFVAKKT